MTIIEELRTADVFGTVLQARALLLSDPATTGAQERPSVVISAVAGAGEVDEVARAILRPDEMNDLPMIDSWIIDLSLRDERIAVVTKTDVLTCVPLFLVPHGWTAAVAAQGVLTVVVQLDPSGPALPMSGIPARALREPTVLAARVPVCLS